MDDPRPSRRLHLLLTAPAYPTRAPARGGVQLAVRAQAERLARRHEVTVVAPHRLYPPLGRYARKRHEVPAEPADETPTPADETAIRVLRPRQLHLPFVWWLSDPLGAVLGLERALGRLPHRPDLLHGHWLHPNGFAAAIVGHARRIPVVVTAHGSDVARLDAPRAAYYRWTMRAAGTRAAAIVCVSQVMASRLGELGIEARRLHVIPNGVDLERFRAADRAAARADLRRSFPDAWVLAPERRLLVYAGDLIPVKQVDRLLAAFAALAADAPELALAVVGAGSEGERLRDFAAEHRIADRVLFAGRRPHPEMPQWLGAGDLVVLPSASEGLPLVVLEALAAGTPVVASRVGGVPDCLTEGVNGVLVDPSGTSSLAAGLATALGRSWDRSRVRASAVPFGWDAQVAKLEALYESVLKRHSAPSVSRS